MLEVFFMKALILVSIAVFFVLTNVVNVGFRKWVCSHKIIYQGIPFAQLLSILAFVAVIWKM